MIYAQVGRLVSFDVCRVWEKVSVEELVTRLASRETVVGCLKG